MGNTVAHFSKQQLQDLYVEDNQRLKASEEDLYGLTLVRRYLDFLEGRQGQYETEALEVLSEQKLKDKRANTECVIEYSQGATRTKWIQKKAKYFKKAVSQISLQHPSSFESTLECRCTLLEGQLWSVLRTEQRAEIFSRIPGAASTIESKVFLESVLSSGSYNFLRDRKEEILQFDLECITPLERPSWEAPGADAPQDDGSMPQKEHEITREEFQKHILHLLITKVCDEAQTDLVNISKTNTSDPSMSPILRLLQKMQRILIKNSFYDSATRKLKVHYSLLKWYSAYLIECAVATNQIARRIAQQEPFDGAVQACLSNSFIHHLLHPLGTALCTVFSKLRLVPLASEILKPLKNLVLELEQINRSSTEVQNAESLTLDLDSKSAWRRSSNTIETPHPYFPNTDEERVVRIPGATHLVIYFDPKCSTERRHVLQLYRGSAKAEDSKLFTPFSGRSDNWPQIPLVVEGDTVMFHFKSDPYQTYWGWKCIVRAQVLQPSLSWFYDFERTCVALVARCLKVMIEGSELSDEEKKNASFLESNILARGRASTKHENEAAFLEDLIRNRPDTPASRFFELFNKRVPRSGTDSVGTESTDCGFRATIAALLKHMQLVSEAMSVKRSPESERQILELWKEAKRVREWMIQQRQAENKEEPKVATVPSSQFKDKTKHEYWGENVIGKARFLLDLVPARQHMPTITPQDLTNFIQHVESSEALAPLLDIRKERANARAVAFNTANELITNVSFITMKRDIVKLIGSSIRNAGGHYLAQTKSCGPESETKLQQACYALYGTLQQMFNSEDCDEFVKHFIIDAFCQEFQVEDHEFLHKVNIVEEFHKTFSVWKPLLIQQSEKTRELSGLAFHILCCESFLNVRNSEPTILQQQVPSILWEDLNHGLTMLKSQRSQLSRSTAGHHTDVYHDQEELFYSTLVLYYSLMADEARVKDLTSREKILLFIALLRVGTPRIQCLVLRILRHSVLPNVDPGVMSDPAVVSELGDSAFLSYLFEDVGKALLIDSTPLPDVGHDSKNYRTGEIVFSAVAEIISTLRAMLSFKQWVGVLKSEVSGALTKIPSLADANTLKMTPNASHADVKRALAALAVLGGFTERLRTGARVAKLSVDKKLDECGVLVEYDRMSGLTKVLFDSNADKVIEFDPEKLVPLTEVQVPLSADPLTPSTLSIFLSFAQAPQVEIPKNEMKPLETLLEEPEQKEEEPVIKKQPEPKKPEQPQEPDEWVCPQCTLLNSKTVSVCGVCGGRKPKPTEAKVAPSEPWNCSQCTFQNEPSALSCNVCGAPSPVSAQTSQPQDQNSEWGCPSCTFINPPALTQCAVCNTPRSKPEPREIRREEEEIDVDPESEEVKEEPVDVDPLFHQFRSRALKAFCVLLKNPESSRFLVQQGHVPELLKMAISPTKLETFKSIEQLEANEDLLLEMLYDYQHNFEKRETKTQVRGAANINYSPFAKLPVQIPSALDRESAQQVAFYDGNLYTIESRATSPHNIGIVVANHAIPGSLPSFYFEMTILNNHRDRSEGDDLVGIGLMREGMTLEGLPGHYSFVYTSDGEVCSSEGPEILKRSYHDPYGIGDVVGCLWDAEDKLISFTKNGKMLGPAFRGVNTRVCPAIWMVTKLSRVSVNFGREPWSFDFTKTLPASFLRELREAEKKGRVLSVADRERRTKAEAMIEMFGQMAYPLEIYMAALERNGDDPQIAASWLLEKGPEYLESLYQDFLNQPNPQVRDAAPDMDTDDNDDTLQDRHAARYLDDELDADIPVQVQEDRRKAHRRASDLLKVEDIYVGMLLNVSRAAQFLDEKSQRLIGRTGIVHRLDLEKLKVTLVFLNNNTASKRTHEFDYKLLEQPLSVFNNPYANFKGDCSKICRTFSSIETNLSVLKIRRSVLSLLLENEEFDFDMDALGAQNVLNLLKLAASEFLYATFVTTRRRTSHPLLDAFQSRLGILLKKEADVPPQPLYASAKGIVTNPSLTRKLTQEVIHHLQQAVEIPPPFLTEESAHNYAPSQDYRKKLHIPGASRLMIRFHPRCQVNTDTLTRVAFYLTDDYTRMAAVFNGDTFQDLVINSDTIYFRFTSGLGKTFWGYKFSVVPLELRLNDIQALQGLNLELGHWLLDLLLQKGPQYVTDEYLLDLFNALVWYVSSAKRSAKSRGIQLVLQLFQEMKKAPRHQRKRALVAQKTRLGQILKNAAQLFEKESKEVEQLEGLMFSELLQHSVELLIQIYTAAKALQLPSFFPEVEWFEDILGVAEKATELSNKEGPGLISYKPGSEDDFGEPTQGIDGDDITALAATLAFSMQSSGTDGTVKLKIVYEANELENNFAKDMPVSELITTTAAHFGLDAATLILEERGFLIRLTRLTATKYTLANKETVGEVFKSSAILRVRTNQQDPDSLFVLPKLTSEEEKAMALPWNSSMYASLIALVSDLCDQNDFIPPLLGFSIENIKISPNTNEKYPLLRDIPLAIIRRQFIALQQFNKNLCQVLPLVDFQSAGAEWSIVCTISKIREMVFFEVKMREWDKLVTSTSTNGLSTSITIDRPKAERAREKGDPSGSRSFFGQAFRQLHFISPTNLRTNSDYPWKVTYTGEEGTDAGGLFRDCITNMCLDLQSSYLPLFVPCPNSSGVGENQERWVPNPESVSSLDLSMFAFVGKMMGIAIRGQHTLNLDLPSVVWKQLVGDPVLPNDIIAVDAIAFNTPDMVMSLTQDQFEYADYTFVANRANGKTIDLKKDGSQIQVTWETREEFAKLWKQYKLNEFNTQVTAIKDGLAAIVPVQLLALFTWQELELQVCGQRDINVSFLRENTVYNQPFNKDSTQVLWLFEMLEKFTQKERESFLRFVWGRSRLPISSSLFDQKFQVTGCAHNEEGALPISHTCFFQLELPQYKRKETLEEKVVFAMNNCSTISLY